MGGVKSKSKIKISKKAIKPFTKLIDPPFTKHQMTTPIVINNNEIIMVTSIETTKPITEQKDVESPKLYLLKYDINNKIWCKWVNCPFSTLLSTVYSLTFNFENNLLYFFLSAKIKENAGFIITFNFKTKQWNKIKHTLFTGGLSTLIIADNKLCVIGGTQNKYIYEWNNDQNEFKRISEELVMTENDHNISYDGFSVKSAVYLKSRKELILIRGSFLASHASAVTSKIRILKLNDFKFREIKIPFTLTYGRIHLLTLNEKYIITFTVYNTIYIFNTANWKVTHLKIQYPSIAAEFAMYSAVLIGNELNPENIILINGFIRRLYINNIPNGIIHIIQKYSDSGMIHLFARSQQPFTRKIEHSRHWIVKTEQITESEHVEVKDDGSYCVCHGAQYCPNEGKFNYKVKRVFPKK